MAAFRRSSQRVAYEQRLELRQCPVDSYQRPPTRIAQDQMFKLSFPCRVEGIIKWTSHKIPGNIFGELDSQKAMRPACTVSNHSNKPQADGTHAFGGIKVERPLRTTKLILNLSSDQHGA